MINRHFSYVLPVRFEPGQDGAASALTPYLHCLTQWCDDVIVVDGSAPAARAAHALQWPTELRLVAPAPAHDCLNGKVSGVLTGIALACHERVVIADDDVRYDQDALARTVALLNEADLVRPQNYFSPVPWHAAWDSARSLINRATLGADFPGTLAVRRSTLSSAGGYSGDVLFENLELIRTIRARGGTVISPLDLYVRRLPPTARQFLGQRVRQAYDDFAMPARMVLWLGVLPGLSWPTRGRSRRWTGAAAAVTALAQWGRLRAGGSARFPVRAALCAPLWVLERSCCAWLAVGQRLTLGGTRYRGAVIQVAAHSERALRHRSEASTLNTVR